MSIMLFSVHCLLITDPSIRHHHPVLQHAKILNLHFAHIPVFRNTGG